MPFWEVLEFLHCSYFDNGVEVRRLNTQSEQKEMLEDIISRLKKEE